METAVTNRLSSRYSDNTLIARSNPKPFLSMGIGKNDKDTVLFTTS